ncbi:hypothetical protein ACQP3J_31100, partial [Escherichia coli]
AGPLNLRGRLRKKGGGMIREVGAREEPRLTSGGRQRVEGRARAFFLIMYVFVVVLFHSQNSDIFLSQI